MAVSRAMARLLGVRAMEEEQSQAELKRALDELRRLEAALAAAGKRERLGRRWLAASAATGELADRVAAMEEMRAGRGHAEKLRPRIAEAERVAAARRQEFLAKRAERRQVESLIHRQEAEEAAESGRLRQREIDDWFLRRML